MRAHSWYRPHVDNKRREFETDNRWTAGGGVRLLLAQWCNTGLGLMARSNMGSLLFNGSRSTAFYFSSGHVTYREYQGSIAVYHTMGFLRLISGLNIPMSTQMLADYQKRFTLGGILSDQPMPVWHGDRMFALPKEESRCEPRGPVD